MRKGVFLTGLVAIACRAESFYTEEEVLKKATDASPALAASVDREEAAQNEIRSAKAGYLPKLDLQFIDSKGFAGSNSQLQIGGIAGSPFRSGLAGALNVKQTVWDFGRTSSVVGLQIQNKRLRAEETDVTKILIKKHVLESFYECMRAKGIWLVWKNLESESMNIASEIDRLVHSGQRSVVSGKLAHVQLQEAVTAVADWKISYVESRERLQLLLGDLDSTKDCPEVPERVSEIPWEELQKNDSNPLVQRAAVSVSLAEGRVRVARSSYMPFVNVVGSVGMMENHRLVSQNDYSVGIGLTIPLFDGRTASGLSAAKAYAEASEKELSQANVEMNELRLRLVEKLKSAAIRIRQSQLEMKLAQEAFDLAKERYKTTEGSLIDLRDALRNLSRVHIQAIEAKIEWQTAHSIGRVYFARSS